MPNYDFPRVLDTDIFPNFFFTIFFLLLSVSLLQAVMEIEKYQCLRVKISGACCKLPDPIETIAFECLVRGKQTRSVVITNDSTHTWKLKVEVTGDYFSVDETLQVPSLQFAPCIVTYSPLVMNSENTLHMVESQPT